MGSRANSKIFFGIYFEEAYDVFEDSRDFEVEEVCEMIQQGEFQEFQLDSVHVYDETSYILTVNEGYFGGDWDEPEEVNISEILSATTYKSQFKKLCDKFKINYKEPKVLMVSGYF